MRMVRIDLDQKLLAAAGAVLGTSDSRATITEALRRIVVHERQRQHMERLAASALTGQPSRKPNVVED
ncbi:type II toxin-antitoxin system VapB family antitoxin [Nocardia brevicatena]|uniref:type II toxin-antitoxin system VapB family antitoxin n=1 Tax=Nocardia brevicatena TaxID=37327 RepID=UPI00031F52AE|nr:type II toxin-antitoxin system VapB family antitoxin [Nocardia brevicatena]